MPPVLLVLKRYAAQVVQGCWEERLAGAGLEEVAERWEVACSRTVQRWLAPLVTRPEQTAWWQLGDRVGGELRRLLPVVVEPVAHSASQLLNLARLTAEHAPSAPFDTSRTPYHFVQAALTRLTMS